MEKNVWTRTFRGNSGIAKRTIFWGIWFFGSEIPTIIVEYRCEMIAMCVDRLEAFLCHNFVQEGRT